MSIMIVAFVAPFSYSTAQPNNSHAIAITITITKPILAVYIVACLASHMDQMRPCLPVFLSYPPSLCVSIFVMNSRLRKCLNDFLSWLMAWTPVYKILGHLYYYFFRIALCYHFIYFFGIFLFALVNKDSTGFLIIACVYVRVTENIMFIMGKFEFFLTNLFTPNTRTIEFFHRYKTLNKYAREN